MSRLRGEGGSTMVAAMATLLVVGLLGGAVLSLATRRLDTSQRDRSVARAAAAADAAADVAGYRMNRTLVSAGGAGLLGIATDTVRQLGCAEVAAAGIEVIAAGASASWCAATPWEDLGDGARYRYSTSLDVVAVGGGVPGTIERRVVATGSAGGRERRILVVYRLDVAGGTPTRLFKRWRYAVCTTKPTGSRPDSGCPDPSSPA